jgi:two-component system, sensor histidine kinase and response regulator
MKRILIIDDDRSVRESILELLQAEGFQTFVAENGDRGVEVAKQHLPDLILCDVVMPHLDGYGVLMALRQNSDTATIPFIFLTSMDKRDNFRQGMELGADDYLTKPCSSAELLKAIAGRFEKHQVLHTESQKQLDNLRKSIALSLPHELRTPLNSIMGLSEVLIEDYETIERPEILEISRNIYKSGDRLYRLIQNFLLYVELELSLRDPARRAVFLNGESHYPQVLIASIATQIAKCHDREADLNLNLQNARIQITEIHLKKVIEELTDNAFKFSQPGTPINITAVAAPQDLTLYISDRGRGMTPDQIASLGAYMQFERKFYEQQGSGLGLAIAKRLVELHNGIVEVESVPGQQTIVQVTLPGIRRGRG